MTPRPLPRLRARNPGAGFVVLLAAVGACHGQGTVVFDNVISSTPRIVSQVYGVQLSDPATPHVRLVGNSRTNSGTVDYTGALLDGTGFVAALFGGPVGTTSETNLQFIASTFFRSSAAAGLVMPATSVVPDVPPGAIATFQLRAWDWRGGTFTSWTQVLANPTIARGTSRLFTPPQPLGGMASNGVSFQPPRLLGLESFCLYVPPGTPAVMEQPKGVLAPIRGNAQFTVGIASELPVTIQWASNGTNVPGATNQTLSLSNLRHVDAGPYQARVQNTFGSTTSAVARLSIPPLLAPPVPAAQGSIRLPFETEPGRTITLQGKSSVSGFDWITLGTTNSATIRGEFIDPVATNAQRYYRLRLEP